MSDASAPYERNVFINCPFDSEYRPPFQSLIFTTIASGLTPRCALETQDFSEVRLTKILRLIALCRLGIHDISRTEPDPASGLPRFNMPLELGLFLGCKVFGGHRHRQKSCLVLDREPYRYQQFISDIAGQDPAAHAGQYPFVIRCVRDWFHTEAGVERLPGAARYVEKYEAFRAELPTLCAASHLDPEEVSYSDFVELVAEWVERDPLLAG